MKCDFCNEIFNHKNEKGQIKLYLKHLRNNNCNTIKTIKNIMNEIMDEMHDF